MIDYIVVPLGDLLALEADERNLEIIFKKFSCQQEADLENFLLKRAIPYEKSAYGKTFLILDEKLLKEKKELSIVAYYSIALKSIDISSLSKKKRKKVVGAQPGHDTMTSMAAYLIGELGRNDKYSHEDIDGMTILNECYHSISQASRIAGGKIVLLECREHMFEKFYEKQDFSKLYNDLSKDKLYTLYKKLDFEQYWNKNNQ